MNSPMKSSIGQAIDQAMNALGSLEKRQQQIVISTICSLLDLTPMAIQTNQSPKVAASSPPTPVEQHPETSLKKPTPASPLQAEAPRTTDSEHGVDIRSLKNQKQPSNAIQMACIAAYYLQEHAPQEERTKEVVSADLERLFKQAGFKLPARMGQVLPDAKIAGYFESVDRGKYKLTRVGYNLVTHSLPKASAT